MTDLKKFVIVCVLSLSITLPAHATDARQFDPAVQWVGKFDNINVNPKTDGFHLKIQTKGVYDLIVTKITVGPIDQNGRPGSSGWHTHPGSSLVKVTEGVVTLYDAALCTPTILVKGQTFVDEGGGHVHLVRNETSSAAELSVVQLMPRGVARRNDVPRPNNCDSGVD